MATPKKKLNLKALKKTMVKKAVSAKKPSKALKAPKKTIAKKNNKTKATPAPKTTLVNPMTIQHGVTWFEIPTQNIQNAAKFYSAIFKKKLEVAPMGNDIMCFLPRGQYGVHGAVVQGEGREPNSKGTVVYLNGGKDLNKVLSQVEMNGGKIITPKTLIDKHHGYFAQFMDVDGNKVALHSPK